MTASKRGQNEYIAHSNTSSGLSKSTFMPSSLLPLSEEVIAFSLPSPSTSLTGLWYVWERSVDVLQCIPKKNKTELYM